MERIVTQPGSQRFISRFTLVEMESALALKFRTGEIDEQALMTVRRRLEADLGSRRLRAALVSDDHLRGARQLLMDYGRTDASRSGCLATIRRAGTQACRPVIGIRRS